jgi:PAS domain S-box-containing protein
MLDAAFDAIVTMNADGRVVEVNRATERMFGYRAEAWWAASWPSSSSRPSSARR